MTTTDPLTRALALPSGAHFHRCALQVNPHGYEAQFRGKARVGDELSYAREMVAKARELGISVLAITNHNDARPVDAFREAAEGTDVHIIPGFEICTKEGIHVLCLYPIDTSTEQLGRYLGKLGIDNPGPSDDLSDCYFGDLLVEVDKQGGIAIAAHATNNSGLLEVLSGKPRINAWKHENLLSIQIPGSVEDLPQGIREIVTNRNPDYRREHPADDDLAVAVVNACDVANSEELEHPGASCWIKMSEVGIEGLKQAFLDPGSRIRLSAPDGSLEHTELVAVTWEGGGFLDGAGVHLNPNLNVLVGGRGTGKSTIIESIRAVLGLYPLGDEARKAHEGFVRNVLRSGTKVSLLVRLKGPVTHEYRIERVMPNPPVVKDSSGKVLDVRPTDILPLVEIYGQHELSEIAKDEQKRTHLLHRFTDRDSDLQQRKQNLKRELEKNRRQLLETHRDLDDIRERLGELPALEQKLKQYQAAGLEDRLKEQSLLVREEQVFASIPERLTTLRESLGSLKQEVPIDLTFLSEKALEDLPGKAILLKLGPVLQKLSVDLEKVSADFEKALHQADEGVSAVRTEWEVRKKGVEEEYQKILRELQTSRIDGEEFLQLRRRIEELRPLQERERLLTDVAREHENRRQSLIADWQDVKAEDYRRLERAAKKVSRQLKDRVQVEVTAEGDREPLITLLREEVGGRLSNTIETLSEAKELSLSGFAAACREGATEVSEQFGITAAQAERLAQAEPDVLMRIEELELEPTTSIRLNTAATGETPQWRGLEDLSTGQKATAILLLLLLESDAPLIVDQPEDDLDNRFITEGIVPRMRQEKQRRQFIFSTHNANIPVLGDAELIIGLTASGDADGGRATVSPENMGSIDTPTVRAMVEEILEGGREAFERRRRKYGF